jgi:hypothetical protein
LSAASFICSLMTISKNTQNVRSIYILVADLHGILQQDASKRTVAGWGPRSHGTPPRQHTLAGGRRSSRRCVVPFSHNVNRGTRRIENAIWPAGGERHAGVLAQNDAVACKSQHGRPAAARGTVALRREEAAGKGSGGKGWGDWSGSFFSLKTDYMC